MSKILVTGGTVFVSRYIAEYFVAQGCDVYVLNRNSKPQSFGVKLIEADRYALGETLRRHYFDAVIDTAYTAAEVELLLKALGPYKNYIFISSSAVYPEDTAQPFKENSVPGSNRFWGSYGTNKIAAEQLLQSRVPQAYILRPPYLYGPMNNVYREAFVFDCALANRPFYLPQNGEMLLQFFHIQDLCRFIDVILQKTPQQHIFNVGNREAISVRDRVELCYAAANKKVSFRNVYANIEQRSYFSFYNYQYLLDVSAQNALLPGLKPLAAGLEESFIWYQNNTDKVNKKPFIEYIDNYLA